MENTEISVTNIQENMYIIDVGHVRCFLFIGNDKALLVDAGLPNSGVYEKIREITDLPIKLVLTHADHDHTGCVKDIGECYVHVRDAHMINEDVAINVISEGDIIEAGHFKFEVIHIPGHTYGSIALLDEKNDIFITGDTVQKNGPIFMFGTERNLPFYIETLRRLEGMKCRFNRIFPCHNVWPLDSEAVSLCLKDAIALSEGKLEDLGKHPLMPCNTYHGEYTDYLYDVNEVKPK